MIDERVLEAGRLREAETTLKETISVSSSAQIEATSFWIEAIANKHASSVAPENRIAPNVAFSTDIFQPF